MSGLLLELDGKFEASGITAAIDAQAGKLRQVIDSVRSLANGPQKLLDLEGAIGNLPAPSGLNGIEALATSFGSIGASLPTDFTAVLAPLIGPLANVSVRIDARAQLGGPAALIELLRRVIELVTQRSFPGASPMPPGAKLADWWARRAMPEGDTLPPALLKARVDEATAKLDAFGPRLDGPKVIDLVLRAAPAIIDVRKWPSVPVASEVLEVLETITRWRAMDAEQLTLRLVEDLERIAKLIETPRTRVAAPLLEQATRAGNAQATLTQALDVLDPLLARLQVQVTIDFAQPASSDLRALEEQVVALEALANAVTLEGSPLARVDRLHKGLELELARVVRTLIPAYDPSLITDFVAKLLGGIPDVQAEPLGELIAEFDKLDTSFLTNPVRHVRDAVDEVVAEVKAAMQAVEQKLRELLEPVANGLDSARAALKLDEIRAALEGLPQTIRDFFDQNVRGAIEPLRQAIEQAVQAISQAADGFDPAELVEPLKNVMLDASASLKSDEVRGAFAQIEHALQSAVDAIEGLQLDAAADEVVARLGEIEKKLASLDPNTIPEPAQPVVKQAIDAVADVDFTGEIAGPVLGGLREALESGPSALLGALQSAMDELAASIERFKPSAAIGAQLDGPFRELIDTAKSFQPSSLLTRLNAALAQLASRVRVLDPGQVAAPLVALHTKITQQLEALRPSKLLKPVEDQIAAAVNKVFEAAHIDDVFDGIDGVLRVIRDFMDVLEAVRKFLDRLADLLSQPGSVEQALDDLVESTLARFDPVSLARLEASFARLARAVESVDTARMTTDIANALEAAGKNALDALRSSQAARVAELAASFPLLQLRGSVATLPRRRLIELVTRLKTATQRVQAARGAWAAEGPALVDLAFDFQARMSTYAKLSRMEGAHVFKDFATAPATIQELEQRLRDALRDGLRLPVTTVFGLFAKLAPLVSVTSRDFAKLLGVARTKIDSIAGEQGVGGMVRSIEEAADLLRHLDLAPLRIPLDEIFARIESANAALDPTPIQQALTAAAEAIADLLDVATLVSPAQVQALDAAYSGALAKLAGLAPSAVISATLDPAFDALVGDVKPLLELPGKLRGVIDSVGGKLESEVTEELARVEVAFDKMLHAIPFGGGGEGVTVSVSASVSVG